MSESVDSIGKIAQEMRERKVNHGKTTSPTLIAWADRLSALERQSAERIAELERDNENLCAVMIAAAEEIHEHWDAHCDEEGYGPANLMRRLEHGFPAEYGYKAGDFERLQARAERAEAALAEAIGMVRIGFDHVCYDTHKNDWDKLHSLLSQHQQGDGGNGCM